SLENMALVAACRQLGVLSVDLQHGVQGESHVAYGAWSVMPAQGWELLPDRFWVWSESEVAAIRKWVPPGSTRHLAFVGGNIWLDLWRAGNSPLVRELDEPIRQLCARRARRPRILVTLQWGLDDNSYLLPLIDAMRALPEFDWWLRLHPIMYGQLDR